MTQAIVNNKDRQSHNRSAASIKIIILIYVIANRRKAARRHIAALLQIAAEVSTLIGRVASAASDCSGGSSTYWLTNS